jgi:hypothetical protein
MSGREQVWAHAQVLKRSRRSEFDYHSLQEINDAVVLVTDGFIAAPCQWRLCIRGQWGTAPPAGAAVQGTIILFIFFSKMSLSIS